jgi:hypothetical protein
MLKNIAQRLTKQVYEHYLPPEKEDDSKVLQDNFYSFEYRRGLAQYHIYFHDFKNAESQLRGLLKDELAFYEMEKPEDDQIMETQQDGEVKEPKFGPIDLERIDKSNLKDKELTETDEYRYCERSHPFFKVLKTLMLLAEVFS